MYNLNGYIVSDLLFYLLMLQILYEFKLGYLVYSYKSRNNITVVYTLNKGQLLTG